MENFNHRNGHLAASTDGPVERLAALGTPYVLREDDPLFARLQAVTPESWRAKFPETIASYERVNPAPDFDALVRATVAMWIDTSERGYPGESVRDVRCPVLVARGDDDFLVSRAITSELVERLPKCRLLNVPFAAHELHKAEAAIVGQVVAQFLQTLAGDGK